ncbi:unnamed protein product [Phytophthora fragariaefolia]|uniref:Unnamed protein product n=1 Tax=Phytophthora fragariaefolia TaxID=1490495 RepID=A0A9W6Y3M1_9STRA|nr:unnamed protein product [Phytophthora fragariaefolia]
MTSVLATNAARPVAPKSSEQESAMMHFIKVIGVMKIENVSKEAMSANRMLAATGQPPTEPSFDDPRSFWKLVVRYFSINSLWLLLVLTLITSRLLSNPGYDSFVSPASSWHSFWDVSDIIRSVHRSDPATKQYLLHLNETAVQVGDSELTFHAINAFFTNIGMRDSYDLQQRFVIEDLDDRHLFIVPDPKVIAFIEKKMDEWNEKNTYQPPTQ